jgi:XRE family aerobic/anaerobic benzoate catabolism transcriptional regulator
MSQTRKHSKRQAPAPASGIDAESAASAGWSTELESLSSAARENELHVELGRRVRDARAQRFMTRKMLAEQSGISLAYLARVEAGTGNISLGLLQRLALALSLPIETFLASGEQPNADFTMIIQFLRRQSPERLAEIRRELYEEEGVGQRIALIGIRGVGKSTLGPLLAERLRVPFVELNREIEKAADLGIDEIFTCYGQHGFRELERSCLKRIIAEYPNAVLATGGGLVAEAATYELLLASFFTIWLQAKPRVMFERVLAQHDARIASAPLRDEAIENIGRTLEARRPLYELAHATFDTSGKPVGKVVQALVGLLPHVKRSSLAGVVAE